MKTATIVGKTPRASKKGYSGLALALLASFTTAGGDPLEVPNMRAFDPAAIDASANPCADFYQYACGGWHEQHPMPPDVAFWSRFGTQFERQVDGYLQALIAGQARAGTERSADEQKVGDFFAACMDTEVIEARGMAPIKPELALIDGMSSIDELGTVLGLLTSPYRGRHPILFVLHVHGDPEDGGQAKRIWIETDDTLGLPDPKSYQQQGDTAKALRGRYQAHIVKMLRQVGTPESDASRQAKEILALETALAKPALSDTANSNDAAAITHPMTPDKLQALASSFGWADFFRALGLAEDERINVPQPAFVEKVDGLLRSASLDTWKAYLRLRLVTHRAALLPEAIRDAHFDFHSRTLGGLKAQPDRNQACTRDLSRYLPEALSRVFLDHAIKPEMRARALAVFEEIRAVMRRRIEQPDWLAAETRSQALEKLAAMRVSVAHPDKWLDEDRVVIRRDDYYGNARRAAEALRRAAFDDLGRPVDPNT